MFAALKPLLLHLSYFRKGMKVWQGDGTAGYIRELEGDTWVIFVCVWFGFCFAWSGSTSFQFLRLTRGISFWFLLNGSVMKCGWAYYPCLWDWFGCVYRKFSRAIGSSKCFQIHPFCSPWAGCLANLAEVLCPRTHHPNTHSALTLCVHPQVLEGSTLLCGHHGARCALCLNHVSGPKSNLRLLHKIQCGCNRTSVCALG